MLKAGAEHLEQLRDGRRIFVGSERIEDVTTHPHFREAARSVAAIYDMKADPAHRDAMTFEAHGERHSIYFLMPRNRCDLRRRTQAHRRIAELTHGMFGRSPDHVASFVTGMAMRPEALRVPHGRPDALIAYYHEMRARDLYTVYAVVPPQAARNPDFYQRQNRQAPALRVVRETDAGMIVSGMKMLATAAAFANEVWIGNVIPLAPDQADQAITCAIPCNAPGLSLWSRAPMNRAARSEFDAPLAWRYDETDSMVLCEDVLVPWERVFLHGDALLSREIYIATPSHCLGNHQSNVRFWVKLRLIVGVCAKVAAASGADQVPAVRETLGRMAAAEGVIAGMVHGQIEAAEAWPDGYACYNRRMMYAALDWCTQSYSGLIDQLRELCGGSVFQLPADASVLDDPQLAAQFAANFETPHLDAVARLKLFRLAWDLVGSEFAGRHQQYEKFYAGAPFIIRGHSFREAPWQAFNAVADNLMAGYAHHPQAAPELAVPIPRGKNSDGRDLDALRVEAVAAAFGDQQA